MRVALILLGLAAGLQASEGAAFLKVPQGARATGMGSAFSSVPASAEALHYNPAGLVGLPGAELTLGQMSWVDDIQGQSFSFGLPLGPHHVGGFGTFLRSEDVARNDLGQEIGSLQYSAGQAGLAYAYGKERGSAGLALKVLREDVAGQEAAAWAGDIGLQARLLRRRLQLGIAAQQLGPALSHAGLGESGLPLCLRAGLGWQAAPWLMLRAEGRQWPASQNSSVASGLEGEWRSGAALLALRAGYETGSASLGGLAGASVGAGAAWGAWRLDLSYSPAEALGQPWRAGLTWGREAPASKPATTEGGRGKRKPPSSRR